jgi:hypothetical protein
MAHKIHTAEQVVEMIDEYRNGASAIALGRKYGGSHRTILNVLERNGISRRPPGRAAWRDFTEDQQVEIVKRWHMGESQSAIAKAFGTTQPIISKFLVMNGVEPVARDYHMRGAQHPSWRGGVIVVHGYHAVKVQSDDPMACMRIHNGYVLEHRLVMARALGRPLTRDETVHHVNGDKVDNRLENLQLRQGKHGKGARFTCLDCGSHNVSAALL